MARASVGERKLAQQPETTLATTTTKRTTTAKKATRKPTGGRQTRKKAATKAPRTATAGSSDGTTTGSAAKTLAGRKVEKVMHERKVGTLRSGSGQKVTSRKQAIAIGLSEARRAGARIPKQPGS